MTANTDVDSIMMAIIRIESKVIAIEAKLNDMSKGLHNFGE
jgi:hypothetical protein